VPLRQACQAAGLSTTNLRPLRRHAADVYLLPAEHAVAKIAHCQHDAAAAQRAVDITRWLRTHQFPAIEPLDVAQPVTLDEHTVTFWRFYPQHDRTPPPPSALGRLLRQFHALPTPPVALPTYTPLAGLDGLITENSTLHDVERRWLLDQRERLLEDYEHLDSPLGTGHIHGDAYPGNTLWDDDAVLLGDWDEVATGPRELDLANTIQGTRFGRTPGELDGFARAYGHDPRDWNGLRTLVTLRDLHTLGSYLRRAPLDPNAAAELHHRVTTLRTHDDRAHWNAA
jgi:hypothetical protein